MKTLLILLALATTAHAAYMGPARNFGIAARQAGQATTEVTFVWDANDVNEGVEGYYLYCTGPSEISEQVTEPTCIVEMQHGVYECWATAFRGELESGKSNIVTLKVK